MHALPPPKRLLHRHTYPLRILGMGLCAIAVGAVLWQQGDVAANSWWRWLWIALPALAWPHVAYWIAQRSAHPQRTEVRNLLVDSALIAAWVPLMHFSLLPSVLLCTLALSDKIATGIRGLWLWSVFAMVAGVLAGVALAGFHLAPASSMPIIVACFPVLVVHALLTASAGSRLLRKVARQSQKLDELRRIDALTGLYGRGHWQLQAEAALRRHHASDAPASMLMLDIDHFEQLTAQHGNAAGDEVIRALAHVVRNNVRSTDCAGRYDADTFTIILPGMQADGALAIAQRIRQQAEAVRLRDLPALRFTSSVGVTAADHRYSSVRAWIEAAQAALGAAQEAGHNRVADGGEPQIAPVV